MQAILILAMLSSTLPEGVERYARDKPVFEAGISAATALVCDQLEPLDEPTYQKVQSVMVGFTIGRDRSDCGCPAHTSEIRYYCKSR